MRKWPINGFRLIMLGAMLAPLISYTLLIVQRPPQTATTQELFEGVTYQRIVRRQRRPVVIHLVAIDLTAPGVEVIVSPGADKNSERGKLSGQTLAQTTSEFLTATQTQLALNGSFFFYFEEKNPWDYAPRSGDRVTVLGQAIANFQPYAPVHNRWHPLCVLANRRITISGQHTCPKNTQFALSGGPLLLQDGEPVAGRLRLMNDSRPYARAIVATDAAGETLWLIAIDGKQRFYSEGMSLAEVIRLLRALNVDTALNLDGGGSTTLVQGTPRGPKLLNAPIHAKLPMTERPVANHLGIYARPFRTKD